MQDSPIQDPQAPSKEQSRLQLLWDVFAFQFKLAADGLRDVLLSPLAIGSAILGLTIGGNDPYKYFRKLLRLGRRSEIWINLFGNRKHEGTSDELIAPLKETVVARAETGPWIRKAGVRLNKALDTVNDSVNDTFANKGAKDPRGGAKDRQRSPSELDD